MGLCQNWNDTPVPFVGQSLPCAKPEPSIYLAIYLEHCSRTLSRSATSRFDKLARVPARLAPMDNETCNVLYFPIAGVTEVTGKGGRGLARLGLRGGPSNILFAILMLKGGGPSRAKSEGFNRTLWKRKNILY